MKSLNLITEGLFLKTILLNLMAVRLKPLLQRFFWWLRQFHALK